eukprot:TRINITY_DN61899_c0_g1_i1.p2 TRINITY_DN61899_c0_g1~~TRINITY_DN61899_c0_g1_i1.p2  ORF type:complete len:117 (+),score=20.66 TRINITY_DN61899_c0_g1_i1:139-489(+)
MVYTIFLILDYVMQITKNSFQLAEGSPVAIFSCGLLTNMFTHSACIVLMYSSAAGMKYILFDQTEDANLQNDIGVGHHFRDPMYSALIPVSYTHLTLPTILLVQISVVAVTLKKKT